MEPMKAKVKALFLPAQKSSVGDRRNRNVEEWEIRPGGMLVQKRDSDSKHSSLPIPTIKVRVKYGSSCHEICISSQASFGELKKKIAEYTGLHPEEQKLIYKKKERDSKAYLDVARVKDGSKIVLIEDIVSRERRCLQMLKTARIEKASKSLEHINMEVDKLDEQVTAMEALASKVSKVAEADLDNLTGVLLSTLVRLDELIVDGPLKLQKRTQETRVQKYIETLDKLKLHNSIPTSNGGKEPLQQKENSVPQRSAQMQKQQAKEKERNLTGKKPAQQQPLKQSDSFMITTNWETFD